MVVCPMMTSKGGSELTEQHTNVVSPNRTGVITAIFMLVKIGTLKS